MGVTVHNMRWKDVHNTRWKGGCVGKASQGYHQFICWRRHAERAGEAGRGLE